MQKNDNPISYLESTWKIHQNEYKQAYVWSSGSLDNMVYIVTVRLKPVVYGAYATASAVGFSG